MKKRKIILPVLFAVLLLFSKNAGSRMSDMAIVCGMGIDFENGSYTVTVQYLDLYQGTGKSDGIKGNITACADGRGDSIEKAIGEIQKTLSDRLFFGQNEVLVLGKGVTEDMLFSYLTSDKNVRRDILLARTKGNAQQVIENKQRGAVVPAGSLVKQLRERKKTVSVNDYLRGEYRELPQVIAYEKYCTVL